MSVVENFKAVAGVVLQAERLQRPVERCFTHHDVNGRLAGSVGDGEVIGPVVWSFKITRGEKNDRKMLFTIITLSYAQND